MLSLQHSVSTYMFNWAIQPMAMLQTEKEQPEKDGETKSSVWNLWRGLVDGRRSTSAAVFFYDFICKTLCTSPRDSVGRK